MARVDSLKNFAAITGLAFIGGMPFYYYLVALPVVLRQADVSIETVGLTYLIWIPLALKFFWGNLVDRIELPFLYGEKSWLIACGPVIALLTVASATLELGSATLSIFLIGFLTACACAVLQVALGAFIVRSLAEAQHGWANALQSIGASLGAMMGGGVILMASESLGWQSVMLLQALIIGIVGSAAFLIVQIDSPPMRQDRRELTSQRRLIKRPGFWRLMAAVLLGNMALGSDLLIAPFLFDSGVSAKDVGMLTGIIGIALVLVASGIGGWFARRLGHGQALIIVLSVKAGILAALAAIAFGQGPDVARNALASVAFGWSGATLVAFWTVYMTFADPKQAGTDYGAFTSVEIVAFLVGGTLAGLVAGQFGYAIWFATAAICLVIAAGIIAGLRRALTVNAPIPSSRQAS